MKRTFASLSLYALLLTLIFQKCEIILSCSLLESEKFSFMLFFFFSRRMLDQMKPRNEAQVGVDVGDGSPSALLRLPSALMDYSLLPFLDQKDLCALSQVSKVLSVVSEKE